MSDDYPLGEHPTIAKFDPYCVPTRSGLPELLNIADAAAAELQRLRNENLELRREVERLLADVISVRADRDTWRAKAGGW